MAKVCEFCGKRPVAGNNVSHSHRKTRRRWLPNLQRATIIDKDGRERRVRICTRCLRTYRKKQVAV